jgi:hypothetical protein
MAHKKKPHMKKEKHHEEHHEKHEMPKVAMKHKREHVHEAKGMKKK